jgi:hypothetical protein
VFGADEIRCQLIRADGSSPTRSIRSPTLGTPGLTMITLHIPTDLETRQLYALWRGLCRSQSVQQVMSFFYHPQKAYTARLQGTVPPSPSTFRGRRLLQQSNNSRLRNKANLPFYTFPNPRPRFRPLFSFSMLPIFSRILSLYSLMSSQ